MAITKTSAKTAAACTRAALKRGGGAFFYFASLGLDAAAVHPARDRVAPPARLSLEKEEEVTPAASAADHELAAVAGDGLGGVVPSGGLGRDALGAEPAGAHQLQHAAPSPGARAPARCGRWIPFVYISSSGTGVSGSK